MRNVSDKVVEKIKTHILCYINLKKNRTVYEIMWKNILERTRLQMTIWDMHIACWIDRAHAEYLVLTYYFSTWTEITQSV
jgi:hypothetical protein